jgi:hypothetical protein
MGLMSRALWHVNRSPLRYAVKSGVSAWHIGEKRERRRQAQLLNITAAERNKAEELNRNGYAVVTELMDPAVQREFADAGMARLDNIETAEAKQTSTWKKFWVRLLDAEMKDGKLSADNIFVQYALQPSVINVIATALGEIPWLDYVLLSYSRHTGEELASSQLWHRDHDDVRVISCSVTSPMSRKTATGRSRSCRDSPPTNSAFRCWAVISPTIASSRRFRAVTSR